MSNDLQKTFESEIEQTHAEFISVGHLTGGNLIHLANLSRKIGITLREWCESENKQGSFSNLDAAKTFVNRANAMPEEAKTLADVRKFFQSDMVTAGLLELPQRTGPQTANRITPLTFFSTTLGTVKEKFFKWAEDEPLESWTPDRKFMVKSELKWAAELYAKL